MLTEAVVAFILGVVLSHLSAIAAHTRSLYRRLTAFRNNQTQQVEISHSQLLISSYAELYQYFPLQDCQTRVLHVQSAKRLEDPILCELRVVDLAADQDDYVALSYTWGSEKSTQSIMCNGFEIKVTQSCSDALRALRFHKCTRIWVDQVCINQQSLPERSSQVTLMGLIYSKAATVYVYLGSITEQVIITDPLFGEMGPCDSSVADRALHRIQERFKRSKSDIKGVRQPPGSEAYFSSFSGALVTSPRARVDMVLAALSKNDIASYNMLRDWADEMVVGGQILKHRYFERKWIIQELAINSCVKLVVGINCLDVELLAALSVETTQAMEALRQSPNNWRYDRLCRILEHGPGEPRFFRRCMNMIEIFRFRRMLHQDIMPVDPVELIANFSDFVTTQAVDSIYAMRAILPNENTMPIPNYALDPFIVYLQHSTWLVDNGWGARMLSAVRLLLENSEIYPSWTIDFRPTSERVRMLLNGFGQIQFTDYLPPMHNDKDSQWQWGAGLGVAFINQATGEDVPLKDMRPCGLERVNPNVRLVGGGTNQSPKMFSADGFVLDTIKAIEPTATFRAGSGKSVSKNPALISFFQDGQSSRTAEVQQFIQRAAWWETIVQKPNGMGARLYNLSTFHIEKILYHLATAKEREVSSTMKNLEHEFEGMWSDVESMTMHVDDRERVDSVSEMKFALTADGWAALVPKTAQVGDEIAFFHGVKMPFTLRTWGSKGQRRLRGRSHVLSLMWWWDWTYGLEASKNVQTFAIV